MTPTETLRHVLSRRADANKYDFGHVLVIGGSPGMVGAPLLAGEAALRVGAGLVTIAAHAEVTDKLEKRVAEIMTLAIPDDEAKAMHALTAFVRNRKVNAVIIGPGLSPYCATLVRALVPQLAVPMVLDAGALTAFDGHLGTLQKAGETNPHIIATPHAGEYQKLTGTAAPTDVERRKKVITAFAQTHHLTLVLKGHPTLIAHINGTVFENQTGNPGLATAGTGDVLSGMLAGIMAQGVDTANAADAGVYLHGLAGDLAAQAKTAPGMIASDVIACIPSALKSLAN